MSDSPILDAIGKKTIEKIQKLVHGNGIATDRIILDHFDGTIQKIHGCTSLKFDIDVQEKVLTGNVAPTGEPVKSQQDLRRQIDKTVKTLKESRQSQSGIMQMLASRKDKGWGIGSNSIALADTGKSFHLSEQCHTCGGSGKNKCPGCGGQGSVYCNKCQGSGMLRCPLCHGTGKGADGKPCKKCRGKCRIICPSCQGQRQKQCSSCKGSGQIPCATCKGTGGTTIVTDIQFIAQPVFQYLQKDIPRELRGVFSKPGPAVLAKGGHLHVSIQEKPDTQSAKMPEADMAVHYLAELPWGKATISIGHQTINAVVLGPNAKIVDIPSFLDKIVEPGMIKLRDAANGQTFVAGGIRDACRYRLIRDAIRSGMSLPPQKWRAWMQKRYPIGISTQLLDNIEFFEKKALERVTRRPRYIGLLIGLLIVAGLFYGYFHHGWREQLAVHVPIKEAMYGIDAMTIPIGIMFAGAFAQMVARRAMRYSLKDIGKVKKVFAPLGKIAKGLCWTAVLGIFAYAAWSAPNQPDWVTMIIGEPVVEEKYTYGNLDGGDVSDHAK